MRLTAAALLVCSCLGSALAGEIPPAAPPATRVEASVSEEYLTPHEQYGSWRSGTVGVYRSGSPGLSYFVTLGAYGRREGNGLLATGGIARDWTSSFYTVTSVAAGTASAYLPQLRGDNDFNFKLGAHRNLVGTLGVSLIEYHSGSRDTLLSAGLTAYAARYIAEYRWFTNRSTPGDVESSSHLVNLAYGAERWQWTNLVVAWGGEGYLATYLLSPELVTNNFYSVNLKHRRWLAPTYGFFIDTGYLSLADAYEKYSLLLGMFYSL